MPRSTIQNKSDKTTATTKSSKTIAILNNSNNNDDDYDHNNTNIDSNIISNNSAANNSSICAVYEANIRLDGMYAQLAEFFMKARDQDISGLMTVAIKEYIRTQVDNPSMLLYREFEYIKKELDRLDGVHDDEEGAAEGFITEGELVEIVKEQQPQIQ